MQCDLLVMVLPGSFMLQTTLLLLTSLTYQSNGNCANISHNLTITIVHSDTCSYIIQFFVVCKSHVLNILLAIQIQVFHSVHTHVHIHGTVCIINMSMFKGMPCRNCSVVLPHMQYTLKVHGLVRTGYVFFRTLV